jgi:hypothetical protein
MWEKEGEFKAKKVNETGLPDFFVVNYTYKRGKICQLTSTLPN